MSDARKLISDVLDSHRYDISDVHVHRCICGAVIGRADDAINEHRAAEIDKAFGGLTRDIRYGGAYHRIGTERIWREKRETRWVSGWSEVQS